jgi:hypothetical protein
VRHDAGAGAVSLPMIHAHRLAGEHPAIAKLAAGEPSHWQTTTPSTGS